MNRQTIITLLVVALIAAVGILTYDQLNRPRSDESRMDDALDQLKKGNLGESLDELNNRTPMDKLRDDMNDATGNP